MHKPKFPQWRGAIATVFLVFSGVSCSAQDDNGVENVVSVPDGMWLSDGYGYFYEYSEGEIIDFYDVTPDICRGDTAEELKLENQALARQVFRLSEDRQTVFISTKSSPHEVGYRRVERVPPQCSPPPKDTPLGNFDAFVSYFQTHYPFFDVHGVDWQEATKSAREKIDDETSDRVLFDTFEALLSLIRDLHVSLEGKVDGKTARFRAGRGKFEQDIEAYAEREGISRDSAILRHQRGYWKSDIREILGKRPKTVGRDGIKYGITPENVGYIAIMAEGNYVRGDSVEKDVEATHRIMDDILETFNDAEVNSVIIDVSANMGGYDAVSLAIAGHFTNETYLAYTKQAADAEVPIVTSLYVEPADGIRFTGPVYILTADLTRSAGETLTLAIRALPNAKHAGQPTRGSLSDEFYKALPNGWYISMPNEIYTDPDGNVWEGVGIKPEIPLTVFETADPTKGHVEAVKRLIQMIIGN